jgi:hypothetical protein
MEVRCLNENGNSLAQKLARLIWVSYALGVPITFLYQLPVRLYYCTGWPMCSVSVGKGVVWSLIWPIYWFI